jgi:hypothetical protein
MMTGFVKGLIHTTGHSSIKSTFKSIVERLVIHGKPYDTYINVTANTKACTSILKRLNRPQNKAIYFIILATIMKITFCSVL